MFSLFYCQAIRYPRNFVWFFPHAKVVYFTVSYVLSLLPVRRILKGKLKNAIEKKIECVEGDRTETYIDMVLERYTEWEDGYRYTV